MANGKWHGPKGGMGPRVPISAPGYGVSFGSSRVGWRECVSSLYTYCALKWEHCPGLSQLIDNVVSPVPPTRLHVIHIYAECKHCSLEAPAALAEALQSSAHCIRSEYTRKWSRINALADAFYAYLVSLVRYRSLHSLDSGPSSRCSPGCKLGSVVPPMAGRFPIISPFYSVAAKPFCIFGTNNATPGASVNIGWGVSRNSPAARSLKFSEVFPAT